MHLKVSFNWDTKPLYDVIARIPGSTYPDEWIIRGNHHDAWVNGAEDPLAGTNALLEEARGLGTLLRQGWRPKRTIVYCVWDGEEEGLLGSTEWAEDHAEELQRKAAVYINTDGNGRGFLNMSGSHTLEKFINSVARDVKDPETGLTVWKRLQMRRIERAEASATTSQQQDRQEARQRPDLRIAALGSGSDYSAFIDHLGVASLNLGFSGEDEGGNLPFRLRRLSIGTRIFRTPISAMDARCRKPWGWPSCAWPTRKSFRSISPISPIPSGATWKRSNIWRKRSAPTSWSAIARSTMACSRPLTIPGVPSLAPPKDPVPPFLNLAPLRNGLAALQRASDQYDKTLGRAMEGDRLARASLPAVNAQLIAVERSLTLPDGLPGRPWYRNQIYAPGLYTGYGVKTLPGVRESIEEKQWAVAEQQAMRVGKVLENAGEKIQSAAAALAQATP